jgi:clan AA aspartic protease (TIGR02281 family)
MMARRMILGALALALAIAPVSAAERNGAVTRPQETIPIEAHDGAYVVPVLVNGLLPLKFIVDSGSADVSIPAEVASTLRKLGGLSGADLLGSKKYLLADGSIVSSEIYRIESLKIGGLVMPNVTVRVSAEKSSLLLGQSFLRRLKSWSMDNAKQVLIITGNGT